MFQQKFCRPEEKGRICLKYWMGTIYNQDCCTLQRYNSKLISFKINKKIFRSVKLKRIQYHQTSFTINVKQTYTVKKYNGRKKSYKFNPKQLKNGNRNIYINNYLKCKWIKSSNQKTQIGWMDTKTRPIDMLSTRNPLQTSRHI